MKKQYIIIEHRNSAAFQAQRNLIANLQRQLADLQSKYKALDRKYCDEIYFNTCLCDLLRENHIKYRDIFEYKYRRVKYPSD